MAMRTGAVSALCGVRGTRKKNKKSPGANGAAGCNMTAPSSGQLSVD